MSMHPGLPRQGGGASANGGGGGMVPDHKLKPGPHQKCDTIRRYDRGEVEA